METVEQEVKDLVLTAHDELRVLALACLAKAFRGEEVPSHVVQAALSIALTPEGKIY